MSHSEPFDQEALKVKCPHCGDDVLWSEKSVYRPFCSKRCQLIDLGEWASESYRIPEIATKEQLDAMSDEELEAMITRQNSASEQVH